LSWNWTSRPAASRRFRLIPVPQNNTC
jgi:hypothetical protein